VPPGGAVNLVISEMPRPIGLSNAKFACLNLYPRRAESALVSEKSKNKKGAAGPLQWKRIVRIFPCVSCLPDEADRQLDNAGRYGRRRRTQAVEIQTRAMGSALKIIQGEGFPVCA
jgi:hypothetical protein